MAIRHKNLKIRRDELTVLKVQVAEWEVPLLHLVHGEGMVEEDAGEPWADVEAPEVTDEYQRLYAKYKTPPEESGAPGQRAVTLVYGPFNASPLLRQAIEAATFETPADLLGVDDIEKAAQAAEVAAANARAKADRVKAASETGTTTVKPPKAPKAAKAASTSLL